MYPFEYLDCVQYSKNHILKANHNLENDEVTELVLCAI